jgi:hypothetical protein
MARQAGTPELDDLRAATRRADTDLKRSDSAFGSPNNELARSITAAIKPRWNMPSNA